MYWAEKSAFRWTKAVSSGASRLMAPPWASSPIPASPAAGSSWRRVTACTRAETAAPGHGVDAEGERGDDPEVSASAAAKRPEEVRIVRFVTVAQPAVGGHHLRRQQVVGGQPELPPEHADSAAQGEARDPDGGAGTRGQ